MKTAIVASLIASAAAFAPAKVAKSSTAINAFENELGVLPPTGFFDPLGLTKDIDQETFDRYRTSELKHGRVSMLAVIGYIVPEITRAHYEFIPGGVSTDSIPNGVAAINEIPALGWAQMFFAIGAVDYYGYLGSFDVGMPDLGDKEEERKTQELQHGRLAMLAILELLRHDSQNFVSPGFDGLDHLITGLPFLYE
jgi:hypothetical protein